LLRSILFSFFIVWSALAQGAGAATILVWGDSLSAGYGLKAEEAWPALLQSQLRREGFQQTVINASVSGETTAGGRSRLPRALADHKPSVVVVELGANDGLRGLPPQLMADNLQAMLAMARQSGARTLLIGTEMPPNFGAAYVTRFRQTYAQVAQAQPTAFVPFLLEGFAHRREMFQPDGIHPTAEAQPLILQTVWKSLKPLLGRH
jgi:acyl-CoA thioesterase I